MGHSWRIYGAMKSYILTSIDPPGRLVEIIDFTRHIAIGNRIMSLAPPKLTYDLVVVENRKHIVPQGDKITGWLCRGYEKENRNNLKARIS